MSAPVLTHTAQRLVDALGPLDVGAATGDYTLQQFMAALATGWDELSDIARDQDDGTPGFAILFDPDRCPAKWLPWVAQFVGVQMLPNMTEAQMRLRLKGTDGHQRGTPWAMEDAARQYLIGPDGTGASATVFITERTTSAYAFGVTTLTGETPDPAAVLRALLEQKPAGLKMTFASVAGGDLATLRGAATDLADIAGDFADLDAIRQNPGHT